MYGICQHLGVQRHFWVSLLPRPSFLFRIGLQIQDYCYYVCEVVTYKSIVSCACAGIPEKVMVGPDKPIIPGQHRFALVSYHQQGICALAYSVCYTTLVYIHKMDQNGYWLCIETNGLHHHFITANTCLTLGNLLMGANMFQGLHWLFCPHHCMCCHGHCRSGIISAFFGLGPGYHYWMQPAMFYGICISGLAHHLGLFIYSKVMVVVVWFCDIKT